MFITESDPSSNGKKTLKQINYELWNFNVLTSQDDCRKLENGRVVWNLKSTGVENALVTAQNILRGMNTHGGKYGWTLEAR